MRVSDHPENQGGLKSNEQLFSTVEVPAWCQSRITKNQHPGIQPVYAGEKENNMRTITIKVNEYGDYQAFYPFPAGMLAIGRPFPVRQIAVAKEFWNLSGYNVKVDNKASLN